MDICHQKPIIKTTRMHQISLFTIIHAMLNMSEATYAAKTYCRSLTSCLLKINITEADQADKGIFLSFHL